MGTDIEMRSAGMGFAKGMSRPQQAIDRTALLERDGGGGKSRVSCLPPLSASTSAGRGRGSGGGGALRVETRRSETTSTLGGVVHMMTENFAASIRRREG
jgi:hypothetical protein